MFVLPALPYAYNSLEPYLDQQTLIIHHDKHHQAYVNKLNETLTHHSDLLEMSLENILRNLDKVPENIRTSVLNNAGQTYNHNLYWETMGNVENSEPEGDLGEKIKSTFGSFDSFKNEFSNLGATQFGSGWVWLSVDGDKQLVLSKTSNADSPLMQGHTPIMTMDVWEHAYYLNYQNRRTDYISAFWNVVNWNEIEKKYQSLV